MKFICRIIQAKIKYKYIDMTNPVRLRINGYRPWNSIMPLAKFGPEIGAVATGPEAGCNGLAVMPGGADYG